MDIRQPIATAFKQVFASAHFFIMIRYGFTSSGFYIVGVGTHFCSINLYWLIIADPDCLIN